MIQQLTQGRRLSGIYAIVRIETGEAYIGASSNIGGRLICHRSYLRRGVHKTPRLQAAWTEHGESAFAFVLLERVPDRSQLGAREREWLDESLAFVPGVGYNRSPTSNGVGWKYTPEQKARLSQALTGIRKSPEHRAAIRARPVTEAQRESGRRGGQAGRGVPKSAEHRSKIGRAGSANHAAKLTEADVVVILNRLAAGEPGRHLAAEFGVTEVIVSQIKHGRRWRHIPRPA